MGHTLKPLIERTIGNKAIFNNRFVVEICEKVHTHYRNLRIVQSLDDFITMCDGFIQAKERWVKRGCPGTGSKHIELVRKQVAKYDESDSIKINLNENLYLKNKDGIFAEGAEFAEPQYIHLKYRDLRLEMSLNEFKEFADAVIEAKRGLENSSIPSAL